MKCKNCDEKVVGRSDKVFCSAYCKSAYHYVRNKNKENTFFKTVDNQLKQNRRILKIFNKSGKSVVRKSDLLREGFNPKYFTHYWKTNKKEVYLFCYEFGFLAKNENGKEKYVLVTWQPYMY